MGKLIAVAVVVGVVSVGMLLGIMYVSYSNSEIELRNAVVAKQKANEAVFDKVWKTIQLITQVKDDYKQSFKEVMTEMMDKRYSGDRSALAKWVQESNVPPDPSIFSRVMNAIESNREEFMNNQVALLDLNREHTNIVTKFPGSLLGRPVIEVIIVTSGKTEAAFASGKEEI